MGYTIANPKIALDFVLVLFLRSIFKWQFLKNLENFDA